jgi:hypothetical protein
MPSKPVVTTPVGSYAGFSRDITAVAGTAVFACGESTAMLFHLVGNAVGHNATFEGTIDGTNWFLIGARRTDTGARLTVTGVVAGNTTLAYWMVPAGCTAARLRATAHTSGIATWQCSFLDGPVPSP